ncbi:MAG: glycoside hydrolase 43 family protein [Opitutaceae bacterium]
MAALCLRLFVLFAAVALYRDRLAAEALPWGDQGDGTFRNPILPADFSDPDVIRVGDDFYLVASEFHFMGIQVLHSRDLVNWRVLTRVFDRLPVATKYDEMKGYGEGTWAPSLRYHDGRFFLYACTPRDGLFLWTARDPAGPWAGPVTVRATEQWEDPCPFWDDDGQAYLVRGRLGAGPIYLHRMSTDGTQLLDDGVEIYRGPVAEGPKVFKRHGWYYLSLPEGGVERGGQSVLRSRRIEGPYERRVVVPDGGPHQGGLVELDNDESWFIGFKSAGHLGRVAHLQPVRWEDDWPTFGDGGRPVAGGRKPSLAPNAPRSVPQTSDEFSGTTLAPQWQWNHNPPADAWSLQARPGWLRLRGQPAATLAEARGTLTQKLWGAAGAAEIALDATHLAEGQLAGLAWQCGKEFHELGVRRAGGTWRIVWRGGEGPATPIPTMRLRAEYRGDAARLLYAVGEGAFVDTGLAITLRAGQWKGARLALFCAGGGGEVDFDYFRFAHGTEALPDALPDTTPIDREALVRRHNPVVRAVDPWAPLSVGNGGFAFTVDVTGLQTFGEHYWRHGIPLETLARWCWTTEPNPENFQLTDTNQDFVHVDGRIVAYPTRAATPAGEWLRRNPRLHPLGQLALEWDKPGGGALVPGDIEEPEQTLDLWTGVITSRFKLDGVPVQVITACDPRADRIAVEVESEWVKRGKLRVRLTFSRGHDPRVKNTPALDWSRPEEHSTELLAPNCLSRKVADVTYYVTSSSRMDAVGKHAFAVGAASGPVLQVSMEFTASTRSGGEGKAEESWSGIVAASAAHWTQFWRSGAAVDFTGSTNPLAPKLEERIILSRYLTAIQCAGEVPPQESGLTCNTWYGKHHTEMLWWHAAHFILWGRPDLAERSLDWFRARLPEARALAASRGLAGARWAKMVGPDGRESPGGNPLIVWNQLHPIYLADLILRQSPSAENLAKYQELVSATADCLASMLVRNPTTGRFDLGPPLWIAQEIHDPATSRNPAFELAYWRWALETAQRWRVRAGLGREPGWDVRLAALSPLPERDGKYVALESHPDTWDNRASRHDHPEMLMALGFLPPTTGVDEATMERTLDAVLGEWDWQTKIWGWDYPMIAMTATRLRRPEVALEILLRDGPNNWYAPNGHCPQGSDRAQDDQREGRREIAAYLPANGSFLAAVALMVAGWNGCPDPHPGFPADGSWSIRAEGLQPLP